MENNRNLGCLALIFGLSKQSTLENEQVNDGDHQGNAHSGLGGYEDQTYQGGYAAEYNGSEGSDFNEQ